MTLYAKHWDLAPNICKIFSKGGIKENIIEPEKNIQATIFDIYLL